MLVDQSGQVHHQDQRSIFPVELPDVYDSVGVVDHWANSKRGGAGSSSHKSALFTLQGPQPAHLLQQQQQHHHHNNSSHMGQNQQQQQHYQPQQQRSGGHQGHMEKKDSLQLSPVKKRVKESSPPQQQHQRNESLRRNSPQHWKHQQQQQQSTGRSITAATTAIAGEQRSPLKILLHRPFLSSQSPTQTTKVLHRANPILAHVLMTKVNNSHAVGSCVTIVKIVVLNFQTFNILF